MSSWYFGVIFLLLIVLSLQRQQKENSRKASAKRRELRKKGAINMSELIKGYIGKECLIYVSYSSTVDGTIIKVEDQWIEVQTATGSQLINIDHISRIREYPRDKKGKKKAVVLD